MIELLNSLTSNSRINRWFYIREYHIDAYIRITQRYINGLFIPTIEFANIKVEDDYQNQGYFTDFLDEIESVSSKYDRIVYVESIINPILKSMLHKRDYTCDAYDSNSMYKII